MNNWRAVFSWFFRKFWDWATIIVVVPVILGLGAAALYGDQYALALILFIGSVVWIIAKALTWEDVTTHYNRKTISAVLVSFGVVAAIFSLLLVNYRKQTVVLNSYSGYLLPAHDPDKTTCRENPEIPKWVTEKVGPLPDGVVAVFLGKTRYYATYFPYHPLLYDGKPVVTIDRDNEGRIGITADVRSKDGRIVAQIKNGTFTVNQNNILTMKRPDESTLIVVDQFGNQVLNVRYQNNRVIHFQGTLYLEGRLGPVVITDEVMDLGHLKVATMCYSYGPLNMSSHVSKDP